jgi:Zn-dependent protease/predicted transcriptional regulator
MDHSLRIGRINGIDLYVNWSWLIIFLLFTWSLAVAFFPAFFPTMSIATDWIVGAMSSLLIFVSVLAHELSHSFVARSEGIPVSSITLFLFGGVSNITREPPTPRDEFLMAAAGPTMSLAIGIVAYLLLLILGPVLPTAIDAILLALAFYNVALAVFNLLPGFPLDGGRIFRAIVWGITHSFREATNIAVTVGHIFAYLFIFAGVLLAIGGAFLSGLWLVFIGWFLNSAASESKRSSEMETLLHGAQVKTAMHHPALDVPAQTSLLDFVEHYVLAQNLRALPVVGANNQLVGLVTLGEVRTVPREAWGTTPVSAVMLPADKVVVATPEEPLQQAMQDLSQADLNQLPVVERGQLIGLLTRSDIIRYLQVRQELHRPAA